MYILPDTVRTNAVRVKSCKHIQLLHKVADQLDLFLGCRPKDCGMTWTTNHNKAAGCRLVSQPITEHVKIVGQILVGSYRWLHYRWPVVTLW